MSEPLTDDLAFPISETHVTRAARVAREKASAAERAKRWRDEARAAAALDAAIVVGVGRAFARSDVVRADGASPILTKGVTLRELIDQAAKAIRNQGGSYDEGKIAVGARLQGLINKAATRSRPS